MIARYRNRDGYVHEAPERDPHLELWCGGLWELLDADRHGDAPWEDAPHNRGALDAPDPGSVADVPVPLPAGPPAAPMTAGRPTQVDPHDSDEAKALADAPADPHTPATAADPVPARVDGPNQADPADSDEAKERAAQRIAPAKPKASAARSTWAAYAESAGVDPKGKSRDELVALFA